MPWDWIVRVMTTYVCFFAITSWLLKLICHELADLPKTLRDALELLASENKIGQLAALVEQQIRACSLDSDTESPPELDFDRASLMEWCEGVEEFKDKTMDDLW